MDTAFDEAISDWDLPEGGSCSDGPNSGTYTINEAEAGRVACAPNEEDGGIAMVWTDTQLNVLSAGLMGGVDYAALFAWWENEAGPDR
jgi:hypothetical protein